MWGFVAAVALGVIAGLGALAFLVVRNDCRRAKHIRDLGAATPTHDQTGGPTRYDRHGRVTF
jgi:hypothetical protein